MTTGMTADTVRAAIALCRTQGDVVKLVTAIPGPSQAVALEAVRSHFPAVFRPNADSAKALGMKPATLQAVWRGAWHPTAVAVLIWDVVKRRDKIP